MSMLCYFSRLRIDMYAKAADTASTHKPWTEQEVLLLLEVRIVYACMHACGEACPCPVVQAGFGNAS